MNSKTMADIPPVAPGIFTLPPTTKHHLSYWVDYAQSATGTISPGQNTAEFV
jgi:hypothetical protein